MAKTLARFTIEPSENEYVIMIEDDEGETMEVSATLEQLDLIGEAIDELLEQDDGDVVDKSEEHNDE